jgi:hypothetical protein
MAGFKPVKHLLDHCIALRSYLGGVLIPDLHQSLRQRLGPRATLKPGTCRLRILNDKMSERSELG